MDQLLLNDRLAPITSTIGFIEQKADVVVEEFRKWQTSVNAQFGANYNIDQLTSSIEVSLQSLLPLTSVERRRFLFVETNSTWTAYFDNGLHGSDAQNVASYLAERLACRGIRAVAIEEKKKDERIRYGATILELYGPRQTDFLNYVRTLGAVNDGGKWKFIQSGEPLDFENLDYYKRKRIQDRFTIQILVEYLGNLGIYMAQESFYKINADHPAYLVSKSGAMPDDLKQYRLEDAQKLKNIT